MKPHLMSLIFATTILSQASMAYGQQTTQPSPTASDYSSAQINYAQFDLFIEKLSVEIKDRRSFAYDHIRKTALPFLSGYSKKLAGETVSHLSEDEQLAYWLNLHNLLVVAAISTDTKSTDLKKLRGTGSVPGDLWTTPRITKDGQSLSIAGIESLILARWSEPEVIFGLYQGIKGGPRLHETAYRGASVRSDLRSAARLYVNEKDIVKVKKQTAEIAPLFLWHKDNLFGASEDTVLNFLKTNAESKLAGKLSDATQIEARKLNYKADDYTPRLAASGVQSSSPAGGRGYGS